MLQQTQVARVVPAFERFMARFPSPKSLAGAGERELLAHWQGLGYYRRARLLQSAARMVVERHGGRVPTDAASLIELPGVGRYVAGAIASIVGGERAPIVDGNVTRVLLRIHGKEDAPDERATVAWLWEEATRWAMQADDPGIANEALMELGATVCTPRAPRCGGCPLRNGCAARAAGNAAAIPAPKRRAPAKESARPQVRMATLVAVRGGRIAVERRPLRGLWGGLWQTPMTGSARSPAAPWPHATRAGTVRATLTHRRVVIEVWVASAAAAPRALASHPAGWTWHPLSRLGELPLSNAMRRVLAVADIDAPDPARRVRTSRRGAGTVTA